MGLITPQVLHRQHIDGEVLAPCQLHAGTHDSGVFAVADQQPVSLSKGQAPQRQHAAASDVLGEGKPMGRNAAALGQKAAGAVDLFGDVGPNICGEWPELLNACPARRHRLKGWIGQRPLAAVVEIGLVLQGRTQ